ncbi:MAG: ACT domain-containing protein [Kiritimatiellae bacterium]|nr:ACT domain-containing protein [Kiritimatiellia bacterium]
MNKVVITVVGKDTVGILAKICSYLADNGINVCDITQTIVQGYFNMMMIVDAEKSPKPFAVSSRELSKLGLDLGLHVRCQKAEIFEKMHRI